MPPLTIRPVEDHDRPWVARFAAEHWGSDLMAMHGVTLNISQQAGFIASLGEATAGLITYSIDGAECEITSLDSLQEKMGIGSALIRAVEEAAQQAGCKRLFLVTTNDNLSALRFYQRRGFVLSALRPNAVSEARKVKPEIPLLGNDDIPIRDEIELEKWFPEEI